MTVPFPLRLPRAARLGVLLLAGGLAASSFAQEPAVQEPNAGAPDPEHRGRVVCAPDNGGITLPPGFCAAVVADQVGPARHLVVTRNGSVYVAVADSRDGTVRGGVLALRDLNGDGTADRQERFADAGGNGIAYGLGHLFFAQNDRVLRYFLPPWQFVPSAPPATVVSGLPADRDHVNKTIVFHDERHRLPVLFMNIGSATNSCQVENRVLHSPGIDPCPELPVRAGVWRFSAFQRDQEQDDGIRFATGTRNMVALAVEPRTDRLWGVQNGRDQLHENWPELYDPEDDLILPSEEMFRIDRGADYGWPYCYHDPARGMVLAPEYGGDGEMVGRCDDVRGPAAVFPAHWAPLSMLFYTGSQFPSRYRRGAFVAFHGSRFDPEAQPAGPGYNVIFVPFENGRPAGGYEVFADGFAGDGTPLPDAAAHRPVGLAQGPDGSLYITDDKGGRIWRVIHRGGGGR